MDRDGKLLWSCAIGWHALLGRSHQLTDGGFALVNTLADGKRYLEIISAQGEHLRSQLLPDEMVPLLVAGARVYGTLQGEKEHQMFQIDLNGQAQPVSFDIIRPNSAVMWAWPKGEGHMLLIRGKASDLEDFTQRTADQALVYLDETGTETLRSAYLFERNLLHGFEPDAAFNQLGGLTALVKDNSGDKPFNTFSIHVYAPLAELRKTGTTRRMLTIKLIDRPAARLYRLGDRQTGGVDSGFVFHETVQGRYQSFSAKQAGAAWCISTTSPMCFALVPILGWHRLIPFRRWRSRSKNGDRQPRLMAFGMGYTINDEYAHLPPWHCERWLACLSA